uniref:SINAT5 protein n=1 Tax=Fopius arisanus TaxID=64838 RepID=A0A0C9R0A4_9HYME
MMMFFRLCYCFYRTGDCLLQIDQVDIVGLRVQEIASLIRKESSGGVINLQVWRSEGNDSQTRKKLNGTEGAALTGPLPILIRKFLKAVSAIVNILECPVCLETAASPISQCVHGHILCSPCRTKTFRCPVCRVRLGQGRCLIADEIQRSIREAFDDDHSKIPVNESVNIPPNHSLKQKLFGVISSKSYDEPENYIKKYKSQFSRLFRGGFDRAVSADNLTINFENFIEKDKSQTHTAQAAFKRLGELTKADRTKSASTGELRDNKRVLKNNESSGELKTSQSGQYLNIPMTPSWGGSMESLPSNNLFVCPLFIQSDCREPLTQDRLADHLAIVHNCKNQMHLYVSSATISVSPSTDSNPIFIFHHAGQLFIFQYENGMAWMMGTGETPMKWLLNAWTSDKKEWKLQRQVLRTNDANLQKYSSQQAQLPVDAIDSIRIEITQLQSEQLL